MPDLLCSSCCFLLRSSAYTFFPVLGVFQLNEFAYTSVLRTPSFCFRVQAPFIISPPNYNALFSSSMSSCPLVGLGLGWIPIVLGVGITLIKFLRNLVKFANTTNSSITQRFTNLHGDRILSRHISHASSLTTLLSSQHY